MNIGPSFERSTTVSRIVLVFLVVQVTLVPNVVNCCAAIFVIVVYTVPNVIFIGHHPFIFTGRPVSPVHAIRPAARIRVFSASVRSSLQQVMETGAKSLLALRI
jgi:hypothetical protein